MTKITMDLVKELREKTQVGMMDCKKALIQADGDMEKAIEFLRKKGAAVAAKRADNITPNGNVDSCLASDFKSGALIKIGCETDFSANTSAMKAFGQEVCQQVLKTNPGCVSDGENCLMEQKFVGNEKITLNDHLNELIAKIGESIKVADFARFEVENNGFVNAYIHPGANVGVLVEVATDKPVESGNIDKIKQLTKDICMQVAVTNPIATRAEEVDAQVVGKETSIVKDELAKSGKPEEIVAKIAEGKMKKFYEEICLLNQKFIKNDKVSVQQHINEVAKETGLKIEVTKYKRFSIGK